jgi:hypothetical protein
MSEILSAEQIEALRFGDAAYGAHGAEITDLVASHEGLRDRVRVLTEALAAYGEHDQECPQFKPLTVNPTTFSGPCDCGFASVLASVPSEIAEGGALALGENPLQADSRQERTLFRASPSAEFTEALRYYASPHSWLVDEEDEASVHQDAGQRARSVLAAVPSEPTCPDCGSPVRAQFGVACRQCTTRGTTRCPLRYPAGRCGRVRIAVRIPTAPRTGALLVAVPITTA